MRSMTGVITYRVLILSVLEQSTSIHNMLTNYWLHWLQLTLSWIELNTMSFVVGQRTLSFFIPVGQKYTLASQCPIYNNEESQWLPYNNGNKKLGKASLMINVLDIKFQLTSCNNESIVCITSYVTVLV